MNKILATIAALAALAATSSEATPIRLDGAETNLQQIMNGLTEGGASSVDAVTDQYAFDQTWITRRSNSVAQSMIVMELAGYAGQNRFGLYDAYDPTKRVQLFGGPDSRGAAASFEVWGNGAVYLNAVATGLTFSTNLFGFYLETPAGLWFSNPRLNSDSADHMVAYRGELDTIRSPRGNRMTWTADYYLLGWEDLSARSWDQDYNDFVVMVGGIKGTTVPEPATLGLLGLGLAGIGLFRRRRQTVES